MSKLKVAIIVIGAVSLLYAGRNAAQEGPEYRIGIIAPQSAGSVGAAEQQEAGIRAAIEEAKKRWGLRIRIEACDDKSDPQQTLSCALKLEQLGVVAIIGSVNSLCTLELPRVASEKHVPILSAISTATRLTKVVPSSDRNPTWFFRAALSDRYQMHWLAQWLSGFRSLKPDEVAFVYENSNEFVRNSSDEATKNSNQDVYGWGLRQDFLDAEPWGAFAQKPIDVGIKRGLVPADSDQFTAILKSIENGRKTRNNRPVHALGLLTLWDDAREIVTFIRQNENRDMVRKAFGLAGNEEPILFAGSGAFSADFYRSGGASVIGTYLLSPFFIGESSATWQEFRKTLGAHNVDATYPDPYLALGYDSMLVLTSCLNDMSTGKNLGGNPGPIDGHRIALRSCLAAGVDTASLSLVTGLKGFDKSGEALRDLAQTTYILRVGAQNTLVPAASDDAGIQVLSSPWWQPSFMRLLWSLFGAVVAIAAYSLMIRRRQPVVSGKLATPEIETPQIIDTRPAKAVTGESCWFAGEFFFGTDAASQQALQVVRKACVDNTDKKPVILMGPPGVGKTQLAQLIHKSSLRGKSGKPFLVIDCATITESLFDSELAGAARGAFTGAVADRKGLLESADGGTVLFDEIAEIRPELQARILRFLQNNEVRPVGSTNARKLDVRIIAATNKDLAAFRPDLWGRLSQGNLVINIPSLDSHWWDIPEYIDGFLQRLGNGACISDQSLEILSACSWRNNFRGLGCLNESGVAMGLVGGVASSLAGGIITPQSLLASVGSEPDVQAQMARAIENLGMTPPPNEHPGALFPDGMDKWFAKTEPRRAWELVLDAAFNRFRGPQNENFLLPSRESKRLALSLEELATVVGLPDGSAAVKSLRDAGVLVLPKILREKELSQSVSLLHRRQLILFAKRTNFIRLSHEELAEVCGVNRTKYYNFYHYAHALAEEFYKDGVVPPMSRYVIDHKGEAERSDRRAAFANDAFEKRVGVTTESFAILRKLPLLPGRSRVQA